MGDSNETRTAILENNYKIMNKNIENLTEKVEDLIKRFEELPDKLDGRYANKSTEIAVNRLMWIVITLVVTALMGYVLVKQ